MPGSPWQQMIAQADIPPRMSSVPSDEEMMASQNTDPNEMIGPDEAEAMAAMQGNPNGLPSTAASPKPAKRTKSEAPMSQEPINYQQMMIDYAQQLGNKQKELIGQQQLGVNQLQQSYDQLQQQPQGLDYTPLAAWANSMQTNGHEDQGLVQAAQAMKPLNPQQRAEKLLALQEGLQQRKENLSKQQLEGLKEQLNAMKAAKVDPLDVALKNAKINFYGQGRESLQNQRLAETAHRGVLSSIQGNKALQTKIQQIQGIDNAGKIIEDAPVVTPQIFHDYQQALVSAIQRGNSAVGERAERYMNSLGINRAEIQQFLGGSPVSIPAGKENEFYKAMQAFARTERGNIEKQYGESLDAASEGQGRWYEKNPEMKADLLKKIKAMKIMAAETPVKGAAPAIGEVQDGWMFKGGDPKDQASWEKQ